MTNTIHKYHPSQKKWIEIFCNDFYNQGKSRRLFNAILHQGKRWWTYGVAAIVAHAVTRHSQGVGFLPTRFLFNYTNTSITSNNSSHGSISSSTLALMMELTLWTAGFGLAWYTWLSHLYTSQVKERTKTLMDEMDRVCLELKSNVWIMVGSNSKNDKIVALSSIDKDKTSLGKGDKVLGVAMFKCHQVASNPTEEGQIEVAALGSRIQLALVENAIQFARQQDIKVITQDHKKNRLDSFF